MINVANNLWLFDQIREKTRRYQTFSKYVLRKLQQVQNAAIRVKVDDADKYKPTIQLLEETQRLSIHQMMTFSVLCQAKNMISHKITMRLFSQIEISEDRYGEPKFSIKLYGLNLRDKGII